MIGLSKVVGYSGIYYYYAKSYKKPHWKNIDNYTTNGSSAGQNADKKEREDRKSRAFWEVRTLAEQRLQPAGAHTHV